tara:strand:+ start:13409 stop:14446 length:1038 start_codon:yes stop_codon:yes gene_type:complete
MITDQRNTTLGIVAMKSPYVERFLMELDKLGLYSKIVVICESLEPIPIRNMIVVNQSVEASYYSALREHQVDVLVHLGVPVCTYKLSHNEEISVKLMTALLETCDNSDIQHLVYLSSSCVYKPFKDDWNALSETDITFFPTDACNERIAENRLQDYIVDNPHINLTLLRPATVLGPSSGDLDVLESNSWRRIGIAKSLPMQFTHEYDLIDSIIKVVKDRVGGIYNVASLGVIYPREILEITGGKTWKFPKHIPFVLMSVLVRILTFHKLTRYEWSFLRRPLILSTAKFCEEVGFTPKFTSTDAAVEYLFSNDVSSLDVDLINDGIIDVKQPRNVLSQWIRRIFQH